MKEEKLYFDNGNGVKLWGILSHGTGRTQGPLIILCHGFTTQKNNSTNLALTEILNRKDISTFRFDFFGHGESGGKFEQITISEGANDILSAIAFLKGRGYSKLGLFGSSFGGICSLMAASKTDDLFLLVLKAPVSDYRAKRRESMGEEGIKKWKEDGYYIHINSKGERSRLNYSFYEDFDTNIAYDIAKDITIPTLIVHGDQDESVPIGQSRKTASLLPDCQMVIVAGADHRFTNPKHFQEMIMAISNFILKKFKK